MLVECPLGTFAQCPNRLWNAHCIHPFHPGGLGLNPAVIGWETGPPVYHRANFLLLFLSFPFPVVCLARCFHQSPEYMSCTLVSPSWNVCLRSLSTCLCAQFHIEFLFYFVFITCFIFLSTWHTPCSTFICLTTCTTGPFGLILYLYICYF